MIEQEYSPFIDFFPYKIGSKDGYLRLAHASIYRFLRGIVQNPVSESENKQIDANLMAEACLKVLLRKRHSDTGRAEHLYQGFLTYAAKYWHIHVDEADPTSSVLQQTSLLLRSPQFLTLCRLQSLSLPQHFSRGHSSAQLKIPQTLGKSIECKSLFGDYTHFIDEWCDVLQLGATNHKQPGSVERIFWGALGAKSFLQKHGSAIEKNSSYLLESKTIDGLDEHYESRSRYRFLESISDDGDRMAVWKIPNHM